MSYNNNEFRKSHIHTYFMNCLVCVYLFLIQNTKLANRLSVLFKNVIAIKCKALRNCSSLETVGNCAMCLRLDWTLESGVGWLWFLLHRNYYSNWQTLKVDCVLDDRMVAKISSISLLHRGYIRTSFKKKYMLTYSDLKGHDIYNLLLKVPEKKYYRQI